MNNNIAEKDTWNLGLLYKSHSDYIKDFETVKNLAHKAESFKGKLNNRNDILENFKLSTKITKLLEHMEVYLCLRKEKDGADVKAIEDLQELENFLVEFSAKTAFESVELSKLSDDFIDTLINDAEFSDYDIILKHLKEEKKHILDETREIMMSKFSSCAGFSDIFSKLDDIEIKFDNITLDNGEKVELTNANYSIYSHDESQNVRKQANEVMHRGFKNFNLTLSENFINFLKYKNVMAEIRNFNGEFERQLKSSYISPKVVETLVKEVNSNLPLFYDYAKILKKTLGVETFYNSDVYAPIKSNFNRKYDIDEAKNIVKQAIMPLGDKYARIVDVLRPSR